MDAMTAGEGMQPAYPSFTGSSYDRFVRDACDRAASGPDRWSMTPDASGRWITVSHEHARLPEQGWKLHVSATLWSAERVLERALAVLLDEVVTLKVAASSHVLAGLNDATTGSLSQIGKFITVYPNDDAQAVRLAVALDRCTRGLAGPPVPSDRPLRRGSLVHYRYGGFGGSFIQTPIGEIVPALRTPAGDLVPDERLTIYRPPEWAVDPFEAAGVAEPVPASSQVIGKRYAIATTLHQSPRGAVHLAIDVESPRACVIKQARAGAQAAPDGSDARDRLRHEAAVLSRLAPDDRIPRVFDLVEQDGDAYLVMEDIAGETLEESVAGLARRGIVLSMAQVADYGRQVASMLGAIHAAGYAYRDLKPTNVIVGPNGRLRFVDFELAQDIGRPSRPAGAPPTDVRGGGTRGYMSPQQARGDPPTVADDVYSLGALLVLMATGADPSRAPHQFALLERPLRLLNPSIDAALAAVIRRCLDPDPAGRFATMASVEAGLATVGALPGHANVAGPAGNEPDEQRVSSRACAGLARRIGDALCADAHRLPDGAGVAWVSANKAASGLRSRDLNVGSAGTLLALAELVSEFGVRRHREVLADGARWLAAAPTLAGPPVAGLYVGEAGVAAALLRAGQVLGDGSLAAAAASRGEWIATMPFASPDMMNGAAGRLRVHLLLWDETGSPTHLDAAIAAGEHLLSVSESCGEGERRWVIPPGFLSLSGTAPFGYAHGAAGIADALLDLYEATGDGRYRLAARETGAWLARHAVPVLGDGSGLGWPLTEGGVPMPPYWCHGAVGIGRFFLHAAALDLLPEAATLWNGAARAAALGGRWFGPTQCHGLAGSIEFLLDAYQASGDPCVLDDAGTLARLLVAFPTEQDGLLRWPSDWPWVFGPDYLVGYAGVASALLRLADPDRRPFGLSRRGFRHRGVAATRRSAGAGGTPEQGDRRSTHWEEVVAANSARDAEPLGRVMARARKEMRQP